MTTGGLHIDGLGDTFDAIYSNRDKERILEIMKDSRLGTNSLLAIMFLILKGMGNLFIGKGTMGMIITAIVYSSILIILLGKFIFLQQIDMIVKVLSSIIFIIVFALLFKKHVYKKIDGVTGDIFGCTLELGEVLYLIYSYILISVI